VNQPAIDILNKLRGLRMHTNCG